MIVPFRFASSLMARVTRNTIQFIYFRTKSLVKQPIATCEADRELFALYMHAFVDLSPAGTVDRICPEHRSLLRVHVPTTLQVLSYQPILSHLSKFLPSLLTDKFALDIAAQEFMDIAAHGC